jgi:hypothetical protein
MKNVYNEKLKNFLHKLTSVTLISVNNNTYVHKSQNELRSNRSKKMKNVACFAHTEARVKT